MEYLAPGDNFVIYKGNTQEIRCKGVVEKGDCLENQRMPEIEIRNCQVRSMGGFRISTGKRVLI